MTTPTMCPNCIEGKLIGFDDGSGAICELCEMFFTADELNDDHEPWEDVFDDEVAHGLVPISGK